MANERAVKVPDPRADEARTGSLAAIALGAMALGVALSFGFARLARLEQTVGEVAALPTTAARSETLAAAAARDVAPARPRPTEPAAKLVRQDALPESNLPEPRVATESQPTASPKEPAPARGDDVAEPRAQAADTKLTTRAQAAAKRGSTKPIKPRSFEMGTVAYVRCDGQERAGERYPCPRDRAFEEQVWRALERLPECAAADPGRGEAEVRLTLRPAAAPGVEIRSAASGPSLDPRAVSKCVSSKLSRARTRLRSTRTVVSFRFGLE